MNQRNRDMSRVARWASAAFAVATGALVVGPAEAADVCISQAAKDALSTCPGGKLEQSAGKKPQVSFKSAPTQVNLKKRDDLTKPTNPTGTMAAASRDERRQRLAARARALLVTEIASTESLYKDTPKKSADKPKLARRLADAYVELESAAFRDKTEAQIKYDELKKSNPKAAEVQKAEAEKADKILAAARSAAISHYKTLHNDHPKYCVSGNTGCDDEVLYYLAYEYEQSNKLDDARKVYLDLIKQHPTSKFIPSAYFAFGELFFNEAQGNPAQWSFAEQSYKEVVKYKPPDNKLFGYAHYKLGYVYWNTAVKKEDYGKALTEFKLAIDFAGQYTQLPGSADLAKTARRDLIPVYALSGDPTRAHDFFKPLSGDTGGDSSKTLKMMDDLGMNYLDTGHYREGIDLYTDLMKRDRGDKYCEYQAHIVEATLAMKSGNKDSITAELSKMLDTHNKFQAENHSAESKLKCSNATAGLVTETAMAWHLEAVGSGGVRGTNDPKTMDKAAELYEKVVKNFKQEQFAKFEFPRIIKEDWPNIFKIKYAMADLLYARKQWAKCGPAFDSVVAEDPNGPQAPEAAYAAVLCYQNIYTETHKDGSDKKGTGNLPAGAGKDAKKDPKKTDKAKFAKKDLTDNQKGMLTAFNRYVCYIKPKPEDKEANDQYVEVKYARARTYFEAQHWDEAALAFREVAMSHADKEVGVYAAQLYLESLNIMGSSLEVTKPSCYDDMAVDVPKFIDLYCKGGKEKDNAEQCGIALPHPARHRAPARRRAGEGRRQGWAERDSAVREGRWALPRALDEVRRGRLAARSQAGGLRSRSTRSSTTPARSYQAARLVMKSDQGPRDPAQQGLQPSEHRAREEERSTRSAATTRRSPSTTRPPSGTRSSRPRTPRWRRPPRPSKTRSCCGSASGKRTRPSRTPSSSARTTARRSPSSTAQVAFAIGAHYADKEDWDQARRRLSGAMAQIDKNAALDVQVQAHAFLGRVYGKGLKNTNSAKAEFGKVLGLWRDPAAGIKKIEAVSSGEDEKLRRLVKVLKSVGEAQFFFAEEKRKEVEKIRFPEYKGSGTRDDVLKHVKGKVGDWIKKKRPAIEDASKEYEKILDLQPAPPPQWVIAAGSRVGQMWGKFVAEFRAAPIPKEWKGSGPIPGLDLTWEELRGTYYAALDEASEPQKLAAKAAFKKCLDYSVKYQHFDEYSRKCEEWLSKNYSAEFHLVDEFRGSANRVNSSLSEKAQFINIDGSFLREVTQQPKDEPAPAAPGGAPKADAPKAADKPGSKEGSALDKAQPKK
jgi:tetratricopeptide (TPR) repeat protein